MMELGMAGILLILIEMIHGLIGDLLLNDIKKFPMTHMSFCSIPAFGFGLSLVFSDFSKDDTLGYLQIFLFILGLFYITYQLVREGSKCFAVCFVLFFLFIGFLILLYRKFRWTLLMGIAAFALLDFILALALFSASALATTHSTNYLTILLQTAIQVAAFLQSTRTNNAILKILAIAGIIENILILFSCLTIKKNPQERRNQ
eukprot:TRINITY_DN13125_c0_g2_i2.p1 TRINITY_DN13125_c0_g2~~TRINITY_DN13125_c0_g2_i2.p1  ORF type:complete len:203 (-),score=14.46 TRINITY_DN13125_c0_g2_i2:54-662(-)